MVRKARELGAPSELQRGTSTILGHVSFNIFVSQDRAVNWFNRPIMQLWKTYKNIKNYGNNVSSSICWGPYVGSLCFYHILQNIPSLCGYLRYFLMITINNIKVLSALHACMQQHII